MIEQKGATGESVAQSISWLWVFGSNAVNSSGSISRFFNIPSFPEPVAPKEFLRLVLPEERQEAARLISGAVAEESAFSITVPVRLTEDGVAHRIHMEGSPVRVGSGRIGWYVGNVTRLDTAGCGEDVHEHSYCLEELKRMFAKVPGSFSIMLPDGRIIAWNDFMRDDIMGLSEEEMGAVDGFATIHPDDRAYMLEKFTAILRDGKEEYGEVRVLRKGGPDYVWRALHGRRIKVDGELCVMAVGANIDKQKRMASLQSLRLRLQEIRDQAGFEELMQIALDEAEAVSGSMSAFCSLTADDHSMEHLLVWSTSASRRISDIDAEEGHLNLKEASVFRAILKERKPLVINDFDSSPYKRDLPMGHGPVQRLLLIPLMGQGGVAALFGLVGKPSDYTDQDLQFATLLAEQAWDVISRKRAEESLQHLQEHFQEAQEMELLAQLSGGVAHEFNNMLAVTLGYTEMLLERAGKGTSSAKALEAIRQATSRSADLTAKLLAFARNDSRNLEPLDVQALVSSLNPMLTSLVPSSIHYVWRPQSGQALWVHMDSSQLEQVVTNLFLNARDAIDDAGRVSISCRLNRVEPADLHPSNPCQAPGDYVSIVVTDTGRGIASELLPHIFEPFFTTKKTGEGSGLGLSAVYGIVRQNNGYVEVETEEGNGTSVTVSLPCLLRESDVHGLDLEQEEPVGNGLSVLLVEDEPLLLGSITMLLEEQGYEVLSASNAQQAKAVAAESAGKRTLSLLIADIVLPDSNGVELSRELLKRNPGMKVLFMSGYSPEAMRQQVALERHARFIRKPFHIMELKRLVREILEDG